MTRDPHFSRKERRYQDEALPAPNLAFHFDLIPAMRSPSRARVKILDMGANGLDGASVGGSKQEESDATPNSIEQTDGSAEVSTNTDSISSIPCGSTAISAWLTKAPRIASNHFADISVREVSYSELLIIPRGAFRGSK